MTLSIFLIIGTAFSGCILADLSMLDVNRTPMTEYYTEDGVMGFRCIKGYGTALGYIRLNGVTVDAFYELTYIGSMFVTILYNEELALSEEAHKEYFIDDDREGKFYRDEFSGHYADGVITTKNIKLFGQDFGYLEIKSRAIDPTTVNAREYLEYIWKSDDGRLSTETGNGVIRYLSRGIAKTDNGELSVILKWCDGNRFEIFDNAEKYNDRELLSYGTYTNEQLEAEFRFETDALFGLAGQTMKLKGEDIYK